MNEARNSIRTYWSVRALSRAEAMVALLSWLLPLAVASIGVPFGRAGTEMLAEVDSISVLAFMVPVASAMRFLEEGPTSLTRTRRRPLGLLRAGAAVTLVGVTSFGAGLTALACSLPVHHVVALVATQAALAVFASSFLGSSRGWLVPGAATLVASTPGLVPWNVNLAYNLDLTEALTWIAGMVTVIAVGRFAARGLGNARAERA